MSSAVCPLCLTEVGKDPAFVCEGCGSTYHKDCAAEAGSCVVLGCKARQPAQRNEVNTEPSAIRRSGGAEVQRKGRRSATSNPINQSRILLIAAVLGVGVLGYLGGDSTGYQRGFTLGREEGYQAGREAGYAEGFTAGESSGYATGYSEGRTDGCEWVFEQAGNFSYVTAYNPFSFYNKYPGRYYISKSNC